jgi:hypothetical protein
LSQEQKSINSDPSVECSTADLQALNRANVPLTKSSPDTLTPIRASSIIVSRDQVTYQRREMEYGELVVE